MGKRAEALELAVLGLLHDAPMHGYELRKQVNALLGWGRAFSYGTLYPCLKELVQRGYLAEDDGGRPAYLGNRRSKIVYKLTPDGKERFAELLGQAGPSSWDDEQFGVHFAFFARADAATRIRILEGRRSRLQERLEQFRAAVQRTRRRLDAYTLELQNHGLESVEREVRWLDELIATERRGDERAEWSPGQSAGTREASEEPSATGNIQRRGDERAEWSPGQSAGTREASEEPSATGDVERNISTGGQTKNKTARRGTAPRRRTGSPVRPAE